MNLPYYILCRLWVEAHGSFFSFKESVKLSDSSYLDTNTTRHYVGLRVFIKH